MNIVIVTTTNSIKVDFNDLSSAVGVENGTWNKSAVKSIKKATNHVEVYTNEDHRWLCTFDGSDFLQIDAIDGVAPTSNDDLYAKLIAMIA